MSFTPLLRVAMIVQTARRLAMGTAGRSGAEEAGRRENLVRARKPKAGKFLRRPALRKFASTCERASQATASEECGLNLSGNVSPFLQRHTTANSASILITITAISTDIRRLDKKREAIRRREANPRLCDIDYSRVTASRTFGPAIEVRAFELSGPHAETVVAGAVLGLAVLDLTD